MGAPGSWNAEEAQWYAAAHDARSRQQWEESLHQYQRLLASLRARSARELEHAIMAEVGDVLRFMSDPGRADRIAQYVARRFD